MWRPHGPTVAALSPHCEDRQVNIVELLVVVWFIAVWGWLVIEVTRRALVQVWRERKRKQFGQTIIEYRAWKKDLRDRNG
jgi:hypothetical protein